MMLMRYRFTRQAVASQFQMAVHAMYPDSQPMRENSKKAVRVKVDAGTRPVIDDMAVKAGVGGISEVKDEDV